MNAKTRKKLRDRKYGRKHNNVRLEVAPYVNAGMARCARGEGCLVAEEVNGVWLGGVIEPGTPWDLGHDDFGGYSGPEHRKCNRGAPQRNNTSRQW